MPVFGYGTSLFLYFFLSVSLLASDAVWTPDRVPTTGAVPLVFYYRQFLQANPFAITADPKTSEDKAENRRRHQRSAELYTALAEAAKKAALSPELLSDAPANIEKKKTDRIPGTWNLYPGVPINAADLYQESRYMYYRALSHETALEPKRLQAMCDFVAGLEGNADIQPLYQDLKRRVCVRALSFVRTPIREHLDKPDKPLPDERELGEKLAVAVQWFVPFIKKYPDEENLKLVDSFLGAIELYRQVYPDDRTSAESYTTSAIEQFQNVFTQILLQEVEPLVREYVEIYEGILRRWELLGKPMPIWGADLSGRPLEVQALEGKVVLLDFWATWCGPCIAEFPHLKLLYQKYKDKGLEIVGYSVDADEERLSAYLERNPLPWIMLSKESTERSGLVPLSRYYGVKAVPVVLLRDRSGKTIMLDARGEKLDNMLETLFE